MKSIAIALAATAIWPAASRRAPRPVKLSRRTSGCLACHTVDKKLVGPELQGHREQVPQATRAPKPTSIKKVKEGGKGVWGDIPMTPNAHVKDAGHQDDRGVDPDASSRPQSGRKKSRRRRLFSLAAAKLTSRRPCG